MPIPDQANNVTTWDDNQYVGVADTFDSWRKKTNGLKININTHIHGNITSDGKIGSTTTLPIITGAAGILQAGSFGTGAGTFCQGNDGRLSDQRTPSDNSVTAAKIATDAVITAKILNANVTEAKLATDAVSNTKILNGAVTNAKVAADAAIVDTKLATIATAGKVSNSATTATTNNNASTLVLRDGSGYITVADPTTSTHVANKTYVDTALSSAISIISSGGVPGYLKLNNSIIIQWGYLTPTQRETAITLAIPFPNAFLSGTATIGENFTDTRYDDNGFSWGLYPTVGFLKTKVTLMSNLRVDNNSVTFLKMYWIAIGY